MPNRTPTSVPSESLFVRRVQHCAVAPVSYGIHAPLLLHYNLPRW
jgi:hypothetical protein